MFIVSVPVGKWKEVRYKRAIDREKIKQRHKWTKVEAKCIVQFILLNENDACTKQKIWVFLGRNTRLFMIITRLKV